QDLNISTMYKKVREDEGEEDDTAQPLKQKSGGALCWLKGSSTSSKKQKIGNKKSRSHDDDEGITMSTSNTDIVNTTSLLPLAGTMSQNLSITRIEVYNVDLPLIEKSYNWSVGRKVTNLEATVVKV